MFFPSFPHFLVKNGEVLLENVKVDVEFSLSPCAFGFPT